MKVEINVTAGLEWEKLYYTPHWIKQWSGSLLNLSAISSLHFKLGKIPLQNCVWNVKLG